MNMVSEDIYRGLPRTVVSLGDSLYPGRLTEIKNPPKKLYIVGDPSVLSKECVAVVGARRATPYGLHCADRFAGWIADSGYVVVSGGAIGCDQASHRAALQVGAATVAVLGGGADNVYPRGSEGLLRQIAESGAVISENPWNHPPARWTFRNRNRIIAGLSGATLIVEAAVPSGTFSTADYALEAGREVLAVPGSILSPHSKGCNRLISQGATAVVDVETLSLALQFALGFPTKVSFRTNDDGLEEYLVNPLVAALAATSMGPDQLALALKSDPVEILKQIVQLEIQRIVVRNRDGTYSVNPVRRLR